MSIYYQRYCERDAPEMAMRTMLALIDYQETSRFYGNIPHEKLEEIKNKGNGEVRAELSEFLVSDDSWTYIAEENTYIVIEILAKDGLVEKMLLRRGFVETEFSNGNGSRGAIVQFQPGEKDKKD